LFDVGDYREIVMQPGSNFIHTRLLRGERRPLHKPALAESRPMMPRAASQAS
jgi:hypothetical protein